MTNKKTEKTFSIKAFLPISGIERNLHRWALRKFANHELTKDEWKTLLNNEGVEIHDLGLLKTKK